jgi:hypothetical protein
MASGIFPLLKVPFAQVVFIDSVLGTFIMKYILGVAADGTVMDNG